MTETLTHHELIAGWVDDKQGRAIMLTQPVDNYDEPCTVLIHPWQLRAWQSARLHDGRPVPRVLRVSFTA